MNKYGLRYLYKNLGKAVKNLPFAITNHKRVIAVVVKPEDVRDGIEIDEEKSRESAR